MNLSLNFYTQWYWKIDLHNLLHFLSLRADSHAQYEIRAYADTMLDMLRLWLPNVHEAFVDYRMNAFSMSGQMMTVLRNIIKANALPLNSLEADCLAAGLSKRETDEFIKTLIEQSK